LNADRSPWIEIEDVHLWRGPLEVLKGMSASLRGRAVGLVGANGAGKSTLIGALLGVLRARRGRLRVLGLDLPSAATEVRARAGVMAEQAGIFPGGSGTDAVTYAGMLSGLSRREALRRGHRALDAMGIGESRYRPTATYSTGMRQRCKLAMSLVHDPEILILDEPTVGLDPNGREQLLSLIAELRDGGRRVLFSTHLLPDAERVCDELLLIEGGRVAFSGPIQTLVGGDREALLAVGRGLGPDLATSLAQHGIEVVRHGEDEIAFGIRSEGDLKIFWRLVTEAGAEVRSLTTATRGFEEAVVEAMETADER
jgi:ABC-2 type transport system ATP-binding protein